MFLDERFFRGMKAKRHGSFYIGKILDELKQELSPYIETDSNRREASYNEVKEYFGTVLDDYMDSVLNYTGRNPNVRNTVAACLRPEAFNLDRSPLFDRVLEISDSPRHDIADWVYDRFFLNLFSEINNFMGRDKWIIHTHRIEGLHLIISKYEDFRIRYFNVYTSRELYGTRPRKNRT